MKRRILLSMTFLGMVVLLASGLAWTAPRRPQEATGMDSAKEIVLIAPSGDRASVEQMAPDFEAKTGYKIKGTFQASGMIKKMVIDGGQFDVAVLLMPITEAVASGNLVEGSAKTMAGFPIVLVMKKGAPKPDISTPEALKKTLLAANGISYPHGSPQAFSATMTDDMLNKLGILDQIVPKVKQGGVAAIKKGDVDYAILFQPEVNDPDVEVVGAFPASVSTPAPMVGLVSSHSKNPAVAKQLLDYLSTRDAKQVYMAKGMTSAR